MIFKNTAIAFFLPLVSGSFWSIPTNIKFDISYYNSSNCTYEPVNNTRLIFYCGFEENTINEIPQCCYDEINKLEKTEVEEFKYYNYEEKYRILILIALGLLFMEWILKNTIFRSFI